MTTDPMQLSIAYAQQATSADNQKNYADALRYYAMAVQAIDMAIQTQRDPTAVQQLSAKRQQYANRMMQLQQITAGGGGGGGGQALQQWGGMQAALPASTPLASSTGSAGGGGGVGGGGGGGGGGAAPPLTRRSQRPSGRPVQNAKGLTYYVGDKLGSGNFGEIHNLRDAFGRDFVIKILKTNRTQQEAHDDWAKETKFLYSLSHPNILQLYDSFEHNGFYHLVMERCSGSMRDYVKKHGKMSGPDVIDCAGQLLSGLEHIHMRHIIHRDLHIDNILYKPGRFAHERLCVVISDFGIGKQLTGGAQAATTFIGREFDYAPELAQRGHTTKQSDLYQVGLCLYFIYQGRLALSPADGKNVVQVMTSGLAQQRANATGTQLGSVIGRMLSVTPEQRPKTCLEAWQSILALLPP